jgi:hypothetical protein
MFGIQIARICQTLPAKSRPRIPIGEGASGKTSDAQFDDRDAGNSLRAFIWFTAEAFIRSRTASLSLNVFPALKGGASLANSGEHGHLESPVDNG